jgi:hypothetical protein
MKKRTNRSVVVEVRVAFSTLPSGLECIEVQADHKRRWSAPYMKALLLVKCFLFFGARQGADSSLRDTLLLTGAEDRADHSHAECRPYPGIR